MFNKTEFDRWADQFSNYLQKSKPDLPYWYIAQQKFHDHWNTKVLDNKAMIDHALDESTGKWSLPLNEAKKVLLTFADVNADLLLESMKDLFNESKTLDGRIDRFLFHLELLRSEANNDRIVVPDHHHNKYIVSIYLCFHLPTLYFPFDYTLFESGMKKMKALKIPQEFEIERYFKIGRIMTKFLARNEKVAQYYLTREIQYPVNNQLIAYDFLKFINAPSLDLN